ncbi:MAG: hypothetical protein J7480_03725, partial [Microbacteriaceae bacterium]|nr:hypothetical protein [Microbacteriaceae bacterium]
MNARRASQAGAGVAVAVAALLLTVAPGAAISPATAADSGLLLSADGASWFTSLNGNVFSARGALVPGDALPGSFYVMNNRDTPAYLRVGLSDLAVSDASLASALTLTAVATTASDASGSTVGFAAPDAVCTDFLRRTGPLPPHGVALVSADLRFKQSTPGRSAQGELARIGFVVELADIDLNATNTPLCDGVLEVVPPGELDPGAGPGDPGLGGDGVPATPGGGAGGGSGGSGAGGGTG